FGAQRCDPPFVTRRGITLGAASPSGSEARASRGAQHARDDPSAWRSEKRSFVHSQTLPAMSTRPYPFGGKLPTGDVRSYRSRSRFCHGNSPCQVFAISF